MREHTLRPGVPRRRRVVVTPRIAPQRCGASLAHLAFAFEFVESSAETMTSATTFFKTPLILNRGLYFSAVMNVSLFFGFRDLRSGWTMRCGSPRAATKRAGRGGRVDVRGERQRGRERARAHRLF